MKQFQEEIKIMRVMNAVAAGTSVQTSSAVDMAADGGWQSCEFVLLVGALTATQTTSIKAQQSSDDGGSDDYTDLANTKTANFADGDGNKLARLEIVDPAKRYLKAVVVRGVANAVIDGVIAILRRSRAAPISQHSTVSTYESHVRPAEGTA